MPAYSWRTLGDLRQELRARLGMQASGAGAGASNPIIDSFLRTAQDQIYWMADWKKLVEYYDTTIGVGQNQMDYPPNAHPDRLYIPMGSNSPIWVQYSNCWLDISEGIGVDEWDSMNDQDTYPTKFERYDQLLFWPKSNAIYNIKIWYVKELARFTQDNDRASIDDSMILMHALMSAKAHYRHPDAAVYAEQWQLQAARVRGKSIGGNGVIRPRDRQNQAPLPKPLVV